MPLLLPGELGNVLSFDPLLSLVSGSPVGCGCRNSDGWFKKKSDGCSLSKRNEPRKWEQPNSAFASTEAGIFLYWNGRLSRGETIRTPKILPFHGPCQKKNLIQWADFSSF
jgi:hypothetical protein